MFEVGDSVRVKSEVLCQYVEVSFPSLIKVPAKRKEVSTLSCKCSNSLGLVGRETALPTGKENDLLKLVLQLEKVKFSISWPAITVPKRLLPGARTNCKATGAVNMVNTLRIQITTKIRIYYDLVSPRQQSLLTEWLKWQQKIAVAIVRTDARSCAHDGVIGLCRVDSYAVIVHRGRTWIHRKKYAIYWRIHRHEMRSKTLGRM